MLFTLYQVDYIQSVSRLLRYARPDLRALHLVQLLAGVDAKKVQWHGHTLLSDHTAQAAIWDCHGAGLVGRP